jgi:hypothetical protein
MQREFVLDAGASIQPQLGWHAQSARIDNPGQMTITIVPYGITIDAGRLGVIYNYDGATTVPRFQSSSLLAPGKATEPAIITIRDDKQVTDAGQLLPAPDELPPAPEHIVVTAEDSALFASWLPVTANPPVESYRARLDFAGPRPTYTNSITIPNLSNGTAYGITVSAVNAVGEGPSSGVIYTAPAATKPWSPIIDAAQNARANINGTPPDQYPVGTNPTWLVIGGGTYGVVLGQGILYTAGPSSAAVINPQGTGDRTVSFSFVCASTTVLNMYPIHDGVGNNWVSVIFNNVVGQPCLNIQQRFTGVTTTIALAGSNYVAHTWAGYLNCHIVGNTMTIYMAAIDTGGSGAVLTASTGAIPVIVFPPLLLYPSFGFQSNLIGATQMQFIGFTAP